MPRCQSACTIADGANQTQEMLLQRPRAGVIDERRRAAEARCLSRTGIIEFITLCARNLLVIPPEGTERLVGSIQLVIADEDGFSVRARKRRHAIVLSRHPQPIVHYLAGSRDSVGSEAFRQVEEPICARHKLVGRLRSEARDVVE